MSTVEAVPQAVEVQAARRERLRLLLRSPTFLAGLIVVGFWVVCALFGERIAPEDPFADSFEEVLLPPGSGHPFGTDTLGRDVFSRVLIGARDVLVVAPLATLLGIAGGTIFGLITGYFRGFVDDVIGRIIDAFLALPLIVIAVTAIAALGQSRATLVVVIGVVFTPIVARTVRAAVLTERDLDYVQAARLRGEPATFVMFGEILPNVWAPILVEATVRLGYAIFAVAGLTFLGFGVQPPSPDWALQIEEHYSLLAGGSFWWTVLFPALAVATLVVGVNLVADALREGLER